MQVSRRDLIRWGVAGVGVALLGENSRAATCSVGKTLQRVAEMVLADLPEIGAYNGVPEALNGGSLARRMDDWSPAGVEHFRATLARAARILAGIDCAGTGPAALQWVAARELIAAGTRTDAIHYGRPNPFWFSGHVPYVITPVAGPHIDTPNAMLVQQSLATPAAVDAWLEKLESFGRGFDAVSEKIAADEALGCRPPKILIHKSLSVLDAFVAGDAVNHPLIAALRTRTAAAGLDPKLREAAERRAIAALERTARPTYTRLREKLAAMEPRGQESAGVWAQPEGEALYAANVRALGDSPLQPAEIHRLGLEEMRRITGEMDTLLRANGYKTGTVSERYRSVSLEPRFRFPDNDAGRQQVLDYARGLIRSAEARNPTFLPPDLFPRAKLEVRRTPPSTEAGAPFAYCDSPTLDSNIPAIFWLNLRDMSAVTRVGLPTVVYHEAVPGHFTAGAVQHLAADQPVLLNIAAFNAYNEGWALYAERLMAELGAYEHDPFGNLGRLSDDLFRAIRLVVDTGLHHLRWTRERAIQFMMETSGNAESEVVAEVERYMAWPGQALGYKLGELRLLEMREGLRRRPGKRFDLPTFHRAVLAGGALPLDIVAKRVAELT